MGTYSILTGRGESDSLDWDSSTESRVTPSGWMKSDKEGGVQWRSNGPMQEVDIEPLLKHFGLIEVFGRKPWPILEQLRCKSPAKLIRMRRTWEEKYGKPKLEVCSQTPGHRVPAEDVDSSVLQPVAA